MASLYRDAEERMLLNNAMIATKWLLDFPQMFQITFLFLSFRNFVFE